MNTTPTISLTRNTPAANMLEAIHQTLLVIGLNGGDISPTEVADVALMHGYATRPDHNGRIHVFSASKVTAAFM